MLILSPRQIRIIIDLYNNHGTFTPFDMLTNTYNLSRRTIQNDLAIIRDVAIKYSVTLESRPNSGMRLIADDAQKMDQFIEVIMRMLDSSNEFSSIASRVEYIISLLINEEDYIKSSDLSEQMFVSQSTISNDLKSVRKAIEKYDLKLESKPSHGIRIHGNEKNKRLCLIKEGVIGKPKISVLSTLDGRHEDNELNLISEIITNIFLRNEYTISEIVLQNLIVHIHVAIFRIKHGNIIETINTSIKDHTTEYKIAREIMSECSKIFGFPYSSDEVTYLTINLLGKKEFDEEFFISSKTTEVIGDALEKIKQTYHLDLTNEIDLKISLGLHLTPLIIRIENDLQFNNLSTLNIKQIHPLAYNIASDFFSYVFPNHRDFTEDEISYVAIHFITYVENKMSNIEENNIIIISSYRLNDTFLMRQKIVRNIPNINEIKVITELQWQQNTYHNYPVAITAEPDIASRYNDVKRVHFFLTENDIKKIEYALSGLKDSDGITSKFNRQLFIRGSFPDKTSITQAMLERVERVMNPGTLFYESVIRHEANTPSSYFGNGIAILHPEEPITKESFIAIALLDNLIQWDYESHVHTVLLVSIARNKPKEFALWNWLSEFISNEQFAQNHHLIKDFDQFIDYVKHIYKQII